MTGIVKLHSGYSEAVTPDAVIKVKDDGTRVEFKQLSGTIRARAKLSATLSVGERTPATVPTEAELWMNLSQKYDKVRDALRFFEETTTWWSLRKTYQVIETELKHPNNIAKLGWASESEIKRFKEWASYYVHGELEDPPNPDWNPPLSLPEAESFIQGILLRWGYWKQQNQ